MNTQMKTFDLRICRILSATCLSALCLIALSTQAATITVTNTNDSGAGSLRQAIADANENDTIDFAISGTIALTSGHLEVNKNLTISGPGAANLAVNGNASSRVFFINSIFVSKIVTISGLTITNGTASGVYPGLAGGGIYNYRSTLTLNNCTVSGNSAANDGGGIYNDHATLTVLNSTLSGNSTSSWGGGIFNDALAGSATTTIANSMLTGNSAFAGGGVFNEGFSGSATLAIANSTLSSNSAYAGGGIYSQTATGTAMLTITNSTLSGNSARSAGFGGGIYNYGSPGTAMLAIGNTILKTGGSGENIFNGGTVTSEGYNLSDDNGGGLLTAVGDQINTDPMLGPLQDNGGPTFTHELLSGSPAINAGDPGFAPPPDYDQRGPGFSRVYNGRVDIGAFEVQPTPTPSPTPSPTSTPTPTPAYAAQVQQPINPDGSSVFNVRRGVIPVKFALTLNGVLTCNLPPAMIAVYRTSTGGNQEIDESVYSGNADTGSNFRIDSCQYVYNLGASALGIGTYRIDIIINGQVVGSATFQLR